MGLANLFVVSPHAPMQVSRAVADDSRSLGGAHAHVAHIRRDVDTRVVGAWVRHRVTGSAIAVW